MGSCPSEDPLPTGDRQETTTYIISEVILMPMLLRSEISSVALSRGQTTSEEVAEGVTSCVAWAFLFEVRSL